MKAGGNMKYLVVAGAVACALIAAAVASAAPVLVPGPSPVPPAADTVIDFEGQAEGTLISTQYATSGVTFSQPDGGRPMIDNDPFLFFYTANSGNGVLTGSTEGGAPFPTVAGMTATFELPTNLAGAYFSDTAPLGNYTVTARDADGNVLETQVILATQLPTAPTCTIDGCGVWVGFARSEADISSITFGPSSAFGDAFAIDDVRFNADVIPLTADDCKNGGWTRFHIDGATFKNQGDCVSYVATGGKNLPAGG
jgi:opacity protein-like surface antigen